MKAQDSSSFVDSFIENIETLIEAYNTHKDSFVLDEVCTIGARNSVRVIYLVLSWHTKDAFNLGKDLSRETFVSKSVEKQLAEAIEVVTALRNKIMNLLEMWMSFGYTDDASEQEKLLESLTMFYRALRREAFIFLGELRSLFPTQLSVCDAIKNLALQVSPDTMTKMRHVFDSEGRLLADELAQVTDPQEVLQISKTIIDSCLKPLGQTFYFDASNVNRRQASSIMMYLLVDPPNDKITEFIKIFSKRFRDQDVMKYLEIQMVTLKSLYQDAIAPVIKTRFETEVSSRDRQEFLKEENLLQSHVEKLITLAKKLSSGFGVGKVRDNAIRSAIMTFARAGIDFSLSEDSNVIFLEALCPYAKFLDHNDISSVGDYFYRRALERDDFEEDLKSWPASVKLALVAVDNFRAHFSDKASGFSQLSKSSIRSGSKTSPLSGKSKKTTKKKFVSALPSVDESLDERVNDEDEDEELELRAPSNKKISQAKPKAPKKPEVSAVKGASAKQTSKRPSRNAAKVLASYAEEDEEEHDVDEQLEQLDDADLMDVVERLPPARKVKKPIASEVSLGLRLEDDDAELQLSQSSMKSLPPSQTQQSMDEDFDDFPVKLPPSRHRLR